MIRTQPQRLASIPALVWPKHSNIRVKYCANFLRSLTYPINSFLSMKTCQSGHKLYMQLMSS
jgi:hypothetical protein